MAQWCGRELWDGELEGQVVVVWARALRKRWSQYILEIVPPQEGVRDETVRCTLHKALRRFLAEPAATLRCWLAFSSTLHQASPCQPFQL